MSLERLVKAGAIDQIESSDEEIADHLRKARHDLGVARNVADIDLDWAFAIAYSGILQAALALMYFKGYRPKGEAKHYNTFLFLQAALPKSHEAQIERLQNFRKKRNKAVYQKVHFVSDKEATDMIHFALKFIEEICMLLPTRIVDDSKKNA